jgi:hypothetical protein
MGFFAALSGFVVAAFVVAGVAGITAKAYRAAKAEDEQSQSVLPKRLVDSK